MFAAVGNHVERLARVSLGALVLPEKLAIGECMELLHKDVENLFKPQDFDLFYNQFFPVFSFLKNHRIIFQVFFTYFSRVSAAFSHHF